MILIADPEHAAGTIKNGEPGLTNGVVAQVNGNPMTDDKRKEVAAEMVRRWNLVEEMEEIRRRLMSLEKYAAAGVKFTI